MSHLLNIEWQVVYSVGVVNHTSLLQRHKGEDKAALRYIDVPHVILYSIAKERVLFELYPRVLKYYYTRVQASINVLGGFDTQYW